MRKFFDSDPGYTKTFYKKGVYSQPLHHIEAPQSRMRLLIANAMFQYALDLWGDEIKTVTDLGCGDGGLLEQIARPNIKYKGIDIAEANVKYAKERLFGLGLDVEYRDFTELNSIKSDVVTICETLEHLVDPVAMLKKLDCKYLIASVPLGETQERHSPLHLWGWDMKEFRHTLKSCGFKIISHVRHNKRTQIVLAKKI